MVSMFEYSSGTLDCGFEYSSGTLDCGFEYSSGTLDCGFEPKTMKLVFAASLLSTQH